MKCTVKGNTTACHLEKRKIVAGLISIGGRMYCTHTFAKKHRDVCAANYYIDDAGSGRYELLVYPFHPGFGNRLDELKKKEKKIKK